MNLQETGFGRNYGHENARRRRDLMPKWLVIYMWVIIVFGLAAICYATWYVTTINANAALANDPENGDAYRMGARIGAFLPGTVVFFMGELVRAEKRFAIRFCRVTAILWSVLITIAVWRSGLTGLLVGMFMPIFIPYWVGLFRIQRRWEMDTFND